MSRLAPIVLTLLLGTQVYAEFTENFDQSFDHGWLTTSDSFVDEFIWNHGSTAAHVVNYEGCPNGAFLAVDTSESYRLVNELRPLTRVGIVSVQTFRAGQGIVEVRLNTLTQDDLRIDAFVDLWLINANNHADYVRVGLFGSAFSEDRGWNFASSLDGSTFSSGVNYANDTWYRIRIDTTQPTIRVSILDDLESEIVGHSFSHGLSDLGSEFRLGLAQFMGSAEGQLRSTDVAIDYVTTSLVSIHNDASCNISDPCNVDIDSDNVDNETDVCPCSPSGTPTGSRGQPIGDWDLNCRVGLEDYTILEVCHSFSGPNQSPLFAECLPVFDADSDADVDLYDFYVVQQAFGLEP